ncbi:UNVERIFIED_CONTAM: hypothetical protein Slati_3164000 [Sesamum latifolium]|uniref:Uncharacterized protein n=1 Tax=Sesamum latifolium TaxID=2727402 RepID=A0AAW2UZ39_9LAMI
MTYHKYLESARFPQEDHWTLNVEQRFMWMILDNNTWAPMRDDARVEVQMGHWARELRRYSDVPTLEIRATTTCITVEHVACGDGISRMTQSRHEIGSGGIGSWTDYIRYFGVQSDQGAQTYSDRDSTARSRRPLGLPPRRHDGP